MAPSEKKKVSPWTHNVVNGLAATALYCLGNGLYQLSVLPSLLFISGLAVTFQKVEMLVLVSMLGLLCVHCNAVQLTPTLPGKSHMMRSQDVDMSPTESPLPVGSVQGRTSAVLIASGDLSVQAVNPGEIDVEVGGLKHHDGTSQSGNPEYDRPEYKVTERLTKSNTWEPCTDSPCWENSRWGELEASVKNLQYKVLAVESSFKCAKKSLVKIRLKELKDAKLKIFLDHKLHTEVSANKKPSEIDLQVDGQNGAMVRLELVPQSSKEAKARIKMEARNLLPSFDECMAHKKGNCLDKLGGDNNKKGIELRNSKSLQFQCLGRSQPSCTSPSDVCEEWLCCLSAETKALLKDLIGASLTSEGVIAPTTTPGEDEDEDKNDSSGPPEPTGASPPPALCSEGKLNRKGVVCCASGCGKCKQKGCSKRPGGASECCPRRIKKSLQTCTTAKQVGCHMPQALLEGGARAPLPDASETTKSVSLPEVEDDEDDADDHDDDDAPDHAECVDPEFADPESWDCECMEVFTSKCPESDDDRSACLKGIMCNNDQVCRAWKDSNCADSLVQNALVNRARTANNASKSAVALTDTVVTSSSLHTDLDSATQGKCASQ